MRISDWSSDVCSSDLEADVHGVGIGGGMHCDRLDAHFMAGAMDTQRDLAAVGDQDLLDGHVSSSSRQQRLASKRSSTGATDGRSAGTQALAGVTRKSKSCPFTRR